MIVQIEITSWIIWIFSWSKWFYKKALKFRNFFQNVCFLFGDHKKFFEWQGKKLSLFKKKISGRNVFFSCGLVISYRTCMQQEDERQQNSKRGISWWFRRRAPPSFLFIFFDRRRLLLFLLNHPSTIILTAHTCCLNVNIKLRRFYDPHTVELLH